MSTLDEEINLIFVIEVKFIIYSQKENNIHTKMFII